jgi:hypothetical protein
MVREDWDWDVAGAAGTEMAWGRARGAAERIRKAASAIVLAFVSLSVIDLSVAGLFGTR